MEPIPLCHHSMYLLQWLVQTEQLPVGLIVNMVHQDDCAGHRGMYCNCMATIYGQLPYDADMTDDEEALE